MRDIHSKLILASTLLFLFFVASSVEATTPTVTSVSGLVVTGQTLTITGTNMMNENKTNWDSWFGGHSNPNAYGFEGTSPSADFYCDLGPCTGAYDATVKLMGSQSAKFHIQGASSSCPGQNLTSYNAFDQSVFAGDSGEMWIRVYSRWNLIGGSWPSAQIKMVDTQGSIPSQYYIGPDASGAPTETLLNIGYDGLSHRFSIPSISGGQILNNRWYLFEIHSITSATPSSQILEVWMDNVKIMSATAVNQHVANYILFGFINACGTASNFSMDHWMDGLMASSTRIYPASTIEISDNATHGAGTLIYQEPLFLSDGSIQIKANLTGLGGGPYYLFVTDNRQSISAAYNLSGVVDVRKQIKVIIAN